MKNIEKVIFASAAALVLVPTGQAQAEEVAQEPARSLEEVQADIIYEYETNEATYTIQAEDQLETVAEALGIQLEVLEKINALHDDTLLDAGIELVTTYNEDQVATTLKITKISQEVIDQAHVNTAELPDLTWVEFGEENEFDLVFDLIEVETLLAQAFNYTPATVYTEVEAEFVDTVQEVAVEEVVDYTDYYAPTVDLSAVNSLMEETQAEVVVDSVEYAVTSDVAPAAPVEAVEATEQDVNPVNLSVTSLDDTSFEAETPALEVAEPVVEQGYVDAVDSATGVGEELVADQLEGQVSVAPASLNSVESVASPSEIVYEDTSVDVTVIQEPIYEEEVVDPASTYEEEPVVQVASTQTFETSYSDIASANPENAGLAPHAAEFKEEVADIYGVEDFSLVRPGGGDHSAGLAVDFMVYDDVAKGNDIAEYSINNMEANNINYVIWQQAIYGDWTNGQWEPMEDRGSVTANHYDHVHVSFNPAQ